MNEGLILISPAGNLPFVSNIHNWGLGVITAVQRMANPSFTLFFNFFNNINLELCFMIVIMFIFWCVNEKKAFRFGLLIMISFWINLCLKDFFGQPRPYELVPALGLAFEASPAFPSSQAQMSVVFWAALIFNLPKGGRLRFLIWPLSILLILYIGFTQLYLGLHFPTDIFGGWITGVIILGLFYLLEKPGTKFFLKAEKRPQLICAAAAAFLMNALHPSDRSISALFLGFSIGYSLMINGFPFSPNEKAIEKKISIQVYILRIIIGFSAAGLIFVGLRLLLPGHNSIWQGIPFLEDFYEVGSFIHYGLFGFWVSAGAPWTFRHLEIL